MQPTSVGTNTDINRAPQDFLYFPIEVKYILNQIEFIKQIVSEFRAFSCMILINNK